jgi:hypothetical protein
VRFREFEERAAQLWDEIPENYKEGIDGLVVSRDAQPHPDLPDIFTLGECLTEAYPSDFGGPDTTRSVLVLYYGSFWRLSRRDGQFDWEEELWETITHELQHHLEGLAAEDALVGMDYAVDESFKRAEGEPFDPFFYRSGEQVSPGVYRVERDTFIELEYPDGESLTPTLEFDWKGNRYQVQRPRQPGDVCFLQIGEGLGDTDGEVCLVLVRRRKLLASLAGWLRGTRPVVREQQTRAEPVRGA